MQMYISTHELGT